MTRLRVRSKVLFPVLFGIFFVLFSLAFARMALLHPEEVNAKDDAGAWRIRTPSRIRQESYFPLAINLLLGCVGCYFLGRTLRGYVFRVAGESFSYEFDEIDLSTFFVVGPFSGLENKSLAVSFRYEAPWGKKLGSFRLWPQTPMLTYHAELHGQADNKETLIAERTFKHEEEGGEDGEYKPTWVEEFLPVPQQFDEYFLRISMRCDDEKKLIWPKPTKISPATSEQPLPSVFLWIELSVALRPQDLKAWRENPDFDLHSAKVQFLESNAKPLTQAFSATAGS